MIKAGLANVKEPSLTFPTLAGRPMLRFDQAPSDGALLSDLMIGDEANLQRSMLQLSHPIRNGVVQKWDEMERIWDYTFRKLGVTQPAGHKVVLTEAALNPPKNRERMLEVMFERFDFGSVNISIQAILALNSQGLNSGFVVDSGDGVTHLVPVTDGYLEPSLVQRVNLAGSHVTEHLMKLLQGQGHPLNSTADFETVREMKQRLCYVAYDLEAEQRLARETTVVHKHYALPDGKPMRIGAERFLAPEILFSPHLRGAADSEGLAQLVFNTIRKSDINVQKHYFSTILLSGGTTMFPGLSTRLQKDVRQLYLQNVLKGDTSREKKFKCIVDDPPQRQHMVYLGASIMAEAYELQGNSPWWITKAEYAEKGASCVNRLISTKLS